MIKLYCPLYTNPSSNCQQFISSSATQCSSMYNVVYNLKGEIIYFSCPAHPLGLQIKEKLDTDDNN